MHDVKAVETMKQSLLRRDPMWDVFCQAFYKKYLKEEVDEILRTRLSDAGRGLADEMLSGIRGRIPR
jgi:hypothetical protein